MLTCPNDKVDIQRYVKEEGAMGWWADTAACIPQARMGPL